MDEYNSVGTHFQMVGNSSVASDTESVMSHIWFGPIDEDSYDQQSQQSGEAYRRKSRAENGSDTFELS